MIGSAKNIKEQRDYSKVFYCDRPITDLSRDELLAAFAALAGMYKEMKIKNIKCRVALGEKKF